MSHPLRTSARRPSSCSGTTLIEVLCGTVMLVFAALAMTRALIQTTNLTSGSRDTATALRAAELQLETMKCEDFPELFARYNGTVLDDPVDGSAPGAAFAVAGLRPRSGDADGLTGRLEMPAVPDGFGGFELREDFDDATLGMPRDLNGDGAIDDLDHSGDYVLLPLRVVIEWRSRGTDQSLVLQTMVSGK